MDDNLTLDLAIRGRDGTGDQGSPFFGGEHVFQNDPILAEIQLPHGHWMLAAVPRGGWSNSPDGIALQRLMFLIAIALIVSPLVLLARTRERLLDAATRRHQAEQERQRLELQVLNSQKLESLGLLAGGVAHDFNNTLTAILGYVQLLTENPSLDSESQDFLYQIDKASQRAASLCRQLLAYSGKGQFVVEPIDASALILETAELLQVSTPKKTRVQLDLASNLPMILADASQLRQVVMNLITNATEAIGTETGVVTIQTRLTEMDQKQLGDNLAGNLCMAGSYVQIQVTDSGGGMDTETMKSVFDPFFTTKTSGRGLGMAAVLGIVRSLRGCILCESELGSGTSFVVALPPTERLKETSTPEPTGTTLGVTGTVLIVDDEPAVRSVIAKALKQIGLRVILAEDGQAGVDLFKLHADDISLCLIDLSMPRMGGREALRIIRQHRPQTRVILMSGYTTDELDHTASSDQANAFLDKPFNLKDLISTVTNVANDVVSVR